MHHFTYRAGQLHCEDVALADIADAVGTPVYVYSAATLTRHARVIQGAFQSQRSLIAYSVKANGNLAVLALLAREGCGADVVSLGELLRAQAAGIPANRIVFSGVGKTRAEMDAALRAGIHQFNVESEAELHALDAAAQALGLQAPVALRVNPDVAAGGHPNISTGKAGDKFGVPWGEARRLYREAQKLPGIRPVGVDVHIGSQITDIAPMRAAFEKVAALFRELRADGIALDRLDLGGGLGIPYAAGDDPDPPSAYAAMIADVTAGLDAQVILEPGRVIAGNAGVLLASALYRKAAPDRDFLILDAGMNDLLRPALYGAHHDILPLAEAPADAQLAPVDVVGPICESTDVFARGRELPPVESGDIVALMSAGAYGAVLSSQYNARPLVPEVLVSGARFDVVRRRPLPSEMLTLEAVPSWLTP